MDSIGMHEIESILYKRGFRGAELEDIAREIMRESQGDPQIAIELAYRVTHIDPR